jgi:hypothetical protein
MEATRLSPVALAARAPLACHTNWTMKTALSDAEIEKERAYIIAERLAILCGTDEPNADAAAYAIEDADQWEARYMDSI